MNVPIAATRISLGGRLGCDDGIASRIVQRSPATWLYCARAWISVSRGLSENRLPAVRRFTSISKASSSWRTAGWPISIV
jgi:hypothetical protein